MTGHCLDKDSNPRLLVRGHWDEYVEYAPVASMRGRSLLQEISKNYGEYNPDRMSTVL